MLKVILLFLSLAAAPFWETKEVDEWDEEQLQQFFAASPWALPAEGVASSGVTGVVSTFLATAKPVQLAELESRRRKIHKAAPIDPAWDEFREFLERDKGKYIVLAVAIPIAATREASEMSLMENQSVLRVGKQKIKMSGYFPPSASDGYTRMIFPRGTAANAKELVFEIFVPGTGTPYRIVAYRAKEMYYRGVLEM